MNKSYTEQIKLDEKVEKLLTASQVPIKLSDSWLPQNSQERNCKIGL